MNAGDYRHIITYQSLTEAGQTDGSIDPTWADFATVYAAIEPVSGRALVEAAGVEAVYTHRIRHRPVVGITSSMRIKFLDEFEGKNRYFGVVFPRPVEFRNREMQVMCEERSYEQP